MRRALADSLPEKIRWRKGKTNLGANFIRGLLLFERDLLEKVILNDTPRGIEEYVDPAALRRAYQRYVLLGAREDTLNVWTGITLTLWLGQAGMTAQA